LTNRECPWRCLMCDLWKNTLADTAPPGAIPGQIRYALERLPFDRPGPRHLKLYNAGSFFDPRAIPPGDWPEIAGLCASFERVFILVRPPWLTEGEGVHWAKRSLEFAFDCGAAACSLIPTRTGNGAMEALAAAGEFSPPSLRSLEAALEYGLALCQGRVFADL